MIQKLACGLRNRRRRKSLLARVLFFTGLLCFTSVFHSFTSTGVQYIRSGNPASVVTRKLLVKIHTAYALLFLRNAMTKYFEHELIAVDQSAR